VRVHHLAHGGPLSHPLEMIGDLRCRLDVDAVALEPDQTIEGAAMIEGYSSTLWVPPSWRVERDKPGNLIMRRT